MVLPIWIWLIFVFAFGCCIGSFLNVVIYRLPREKSLIRPASFCPVCEKHIHFYDNIPLISWLALGAKCRYCKSAISARYFVVELLTGAVFVALFVLYFVFDVRGFEIAGERGLPAFLRGGWFVYLLHLILLSSFIAASAIDLELWVIPVVICWLVTFVGIVGSSLGVFIIPKTVVSSYYPLPSAGIKTSCLAAGALIGFLISLALLFTGMIKRSYEGEQADEGEIPKVQDEEQEGKYDHRLEMVREIIFVAPIVLCSLVFYWIMRYFEPDWWAGFVKYPAVSGLLGSLLGYFFGAGIVWTTRIFGTLGFGKEAMGLGDVHLMGAAGAIIGPLGVIIAFFVAPFFGLGWAVFQMFFKKIRQIPYGPFLSIGVFAVMILNDFIVEYWESLRLLSRY